MMRISDQIRELTWYFRGPVIIELQTEDFNLLQAEAEEDMEKAGMVIVADSRYRYHSTHSQGRRLAWQKLTIIEKLNDNMEARMSFAQTIKAEIESTVGITKQVLGSQAPDLGSENGRWYKSKDEII